MQGSEDHLEPKLKLARTTAAERGIVVRYIRSRLRRAENSRCSERIIGPRSVELRIAVLGLIQKVEDLSAELAGNFFTDFPILHHRAIPCMEAVAAEHIPGHGAIASDSRRHHNGIALDEASPLLKRNVTER